MAKTRKRRSKKTLSPMARARASLRRWVRRAVLAGIVVLALAVLLPSMVAPPRGLYMLSEARRLGRIERVWTDWDRIAPVMARSVVAAEDANFCLHWGFDVTAIRAALADGGTRGASTISQQVVKNVYLWQGRSWARKALEALLTPLVEAVWSKQRILEVYLNIAEFDEGVFGIEAAARHYFATTSADLTPREAALLASVLPNPKRRDPVSPTASLTKRASQIADGAATIARDGRAACFED